MKKQPHLVLIRVFNLELAFELQSGGQNKFVQWKQHGGRGKGFQCRVQLYLFSVSEFRDAVQSLGLWLLNTPTLKKEVAASGLFRAN